MKFDGIGVRAHGRVPSGSSLYPILFLFLLGALYRLVLLFIFPELYGGDSVGRLRYRDSIFLWHWLPLLQSIVFATFELARSVFTVRLVVALLGALSACAFYAFLRLLVSARAALLGAVLFTLCPLFVYLSLVPYQEVIFLGLLYAALACLGSENQRARPYAFLLFGLACLTRYEAWFLIPLLLFLEIRRELQWTRHLSPQLLVIPCISVAWGPMLWMVLNRIRWGGFLAFLFHKEGSIYIWQPHWISRDTVIYLGRFLFWILEYGSPLVLLAIPGFYWFWKKNRGFPLPLGLILALSVLLVIFLSFVVGPEFAPAQRFVSIPLSVTLVFSAVAVEELLRRFRAAIAGTGFLAVALMCYSALPVLKEIRAPEIRASYEIARFLDEHLQPGETVVVVAKGFPDYPLVDPMPYQRILAQSNLKSQRIVSSAKIRLTQRDALLQFVQDQNVRYVVLCPIFKPWLASDQLFMDLAQSKFASAVREFPDSSTIYRIAKSPHTAL